MGFEEIRYKGKEVKPDKGFSGKLTGIAIAISHNSDGSITVCKEIADDIYANKRIPKQIRNYFKPSPSIMEMMSDKFQEFK